MASLVIGSGIAIHLAYKSHKKRKAARRAGQEPNMDELQAENQRRFDRINAQANLYSDSKHHYSGADAPPAYHADNGRPPSRLSQRSTSTDEGKDGQAYARATYIDGGSNLPASNGKAEALTHPAYR